MDQVYKVCGQDQRTGSDLTRGGSLHKGGEVLMQDAKDAKIGEHHARNVADSKMKSLVHQPRRNERSRLGCVPQLQTVVS
jgi:hypothetical protein